MGIPWNDDAAWCLHTTEADRSAFTPFYSGNGRLGVRVGPLVLDWDGDAKPLLAEEGPDRWGRLNAGLLLSLAKHAYDGGEQLILPAWNQAHLEIGGVVYRLDAGRHRFRNTLDLRDGSVSFEDAWECRPGWTVTVGIRLVVPRSMPCAAWYELTLAGLREPARLRVGLNAALTADAFAAIGFVRRDSVLLGQYVTRRQQRAQAQGLRWDGDGWRETGFEARSDRAWVALETVGETARLAVVHAFHSSNDAPNPADRTHADLRALANPARRERARAASCALWHDLWATALHFEHVNADWERLVLVCQFHLLASLDGEGRFPLGALGLSRPGWHGSQLWDADFWIFRGVLPLWPDLARGIVRFRRTTLAAACANAASHGFRGAFYPWLATDTGAADLTPPRYRPELHNNIWIARAAWESCGTPPDLVFLADTAWPILAGVADFLVSRATRDADGGWHLRGVVPPDESVCEAPRGSGTCDDNVLTNVGARAALRHAAAAARLLGHPAPPAWTEAADGLVVLPPDSDGVIPEYAGYDGHPTKQADAILAFYPLELEAPVEVVRRTLDFYHDRAGRGGPLMTCQIEALLTMRLGDRARGLEHLFAEFARYVRGPHRIPFETPSNANSVMLTGIGGLLQALVFGWYGARLDGTVTVPRVGDGWKVPRKETQDGTQKD